MIDRIKIQRDEIRALCGRQVEPLQYLLDSLIRAYTSVKTFPEFRAHAGDLVIRAGPEHRCRALALAFRADPERLATPPQRIARERRIAADETLAAGRIE